MTLLMCSGCQKKETAIEEGPAEQIGVKTYISASHINKFGNIYTDLKKQDLYDAGFELGDILTMSFLGQKVEAPFVTSYSDVTTLSTGIFALEDLETITLAINMGASFDEIVEDYMATFYNWYGITKEDSAYQIIAEMNIINTLKTIYDSDDLKNIDMKQKAEEYLSGIGLREEEIADIKTNLSADYAEY
ncbi:MAG: hypothetical protein IIZ80_02845 [Erysipelotrichaceae bacterium]|nr:hypothetical protein [Erysipelotrichaceae bacterium]